MVTVRAPSIGHSSTTDQPSASANLEAHWNGCPHGERSLREEQWNALTHAAGFLLSVVGTVYLFWPGHLRSLGTAVTCGMYAASLMAVYAISTLSHIVQEPRRKHRLRALDQGVIYLLIAGTYTPLLWAYVPSPQRWAGLAIIWAAALAGEYSKVVAQRRVIDFSSVTYLLLGWGPALYFVQYVPRGHGLPIVAGGLSYTLGVYFLLNDRRSILFHPIWHTFVIIGSACHFQAICAAVISA